MAEGNNQSISIVNKKKFENIDVSIKSHHQNFHIFLLLCCLNQWNTMEQFDDIFDIIDENSDTLEYTTEELNRYFESGHLNSIIGEEEIIEDESLNDMNSIQVKLFLLRIHVQQSFSSFFFL